MDMGVYYIGKMTYVIFYIAFCMAFHLALCNISLFCKYVFVKCLKQVYDTSIGFFGILKDFFGMYDSIYGHHES